MDFLRDPFAVKEVTVGDYRSILLRTLLLLWVMVGDSKPP